MIHKLFKKTSTLFYTSENKRNPYYKNILVESSRKSSCWFSKLPIFIGRAHSLAQYFQEKHLGRAAGITAKVCPGIHSVLDNSILIKNPTDISISINRSGKYFWEVADDSLVHIEEHPVEQVGEGVHSIFKNKLFLKFSFHISIHNKGSDPIVFLQPHFHNYVPYMVMNAVVPPKYSSNWMSLNLIVIMDVPTNSDMETVIIKEGTTMAYLWGPNKIRVKEGSRNSAPDRPVNKFIGVNNG